MSSFLTAAQITTLTGQYARLFDTFTYERTQTITIFKEPQQTIITGNVDTNPTYPGYTLDEFNNTNTINNYVTYVPVSGVFPARIKYGGEQKAGTLGETKAAFSAGGQIRIRVEEDCYNYILNGKTESVLIDGLTCNIKSDPSTRRYLGLKYYDFYLEPTT